MLTILIKYQKSKREVLFGAESVEYVPPPADETERPRGDHGDGEGLLVQLGGGKAQHLGLTAIGDMDYRDVYVMNDKGSTVARYTL